MHTRGEHGKNAKEGGGSTAFRNVFVKRKKHSYEKGGREKWVNEK